MLEKTRKISDFNHVFTLTHTAGLELLSATLMFLLITIKYLFISNNFSSVILLKIVLALLLYLSIIFLYIFHFIFSLVFLVFVSPLRKDARSAWICYSRKALTRFKQSFFSYRSAAAL